MTLIQDVSSTIGVSAACDAVDVPRSSFYRSLKPVKHQPGTMRLSDSRSLSEHEKQQVLSLLHEERFVDQSPNEIYATLLDEGVYICSVRTMYRILDQAGELKERRRQRSTGQYKKPELLATGPISICT